MNTILIQDRFYSNSFYYSQVLTTFPNTIFLLSKPKVLQKRFLFSGFGVIQTHPKSLFDKGLYKPDGFLCIAEFDKSIMDFDESEIMCVTDTEGCIKLGYINSCQTDTKGPFGLLV